MSTALRILSPNEADLYKAIYRCESCSHFADLNGVFPFASRDSPEGQTVAVSHFGNIKTAPMWLLLTNPRGTDRGDSNVGLEVRQFAVSRDAVLPTEVPKIFNHFSDYDFDVSSPDFWEPWKTLLDDTKIRDRSLRFDSGGICAVDLIKCPTKSGWMGYVMKKVNNEGKEVWRNCHEYGDQVGNHFLARQIRLHKPLIVIRPGTAFNGKGNVETYLGTKKGRGYRGLRQLIGSCNYVNGIRCLDSPKRLTIETGGAGEVKKLMKDTECLDRSRATIQQIIEAWLRLN